MTTYYVKRLEQPISVHLPTSVIAMDAEVWCKRDDGIEVLICVAPLGFAGMIAMELNTAVWNSQHEQEGK